MKKKAFDDIKRVMDHDALLAYLDFNIRFDIHMNASGYQLGAVIIQEVKPIAFYSRKLTEPQMRYTIAEKMVA